MHTERNGPPKRAVFAAAYALVKLALFAYVISSVGLAGRIKGFPSGLLPGRTAVTKINCRLAEDCIEPGAIRVRNARRHKGTSAPNAFSIKRCILLRNAGLSQSAHNAAGGCASGCAYGRRRKPTCCDNRTESRNRE
jgi:hypothetical protein